MRQVAEMLTDLEFQAQRAKRIALALIVFSAASFGTSEEAHGGPTAGYQTGSMQILDGDSRLDVFISCDDKQNLTNNLTAVGLNNSSSNGADISATIEVGDQTEVISKISPGFHNHNNIKFPTTADGQTVTVTINSPSKPSRSIQSRCDYNPNYALPHDGYWMLDSAGSVYEFGLASLYGRERDEKYTDIEKRSDASGYWIVSEIGSVAAKGAARNYGEKPALSANEKIVSISAMSSNDGYWLFTNLGRAIAYGKAKHFGDMSGVPLNGEVLDSVPTPSGEGYFMVASDGGVFTFGDAKFVGSMGGKHLNKPVESLVPDPDGDGYWLVASDGGIFTFNAPFYGSMGSTRLNKPVNGMVGFPEGYLMVASDGGIFNFGSSEFHGSLGDQQIFHPIVSVAAFDHTNK